MIDRPSDNPVAAILIVDDDEDTRIIGAAALCNAGYAVRGARNAGEALALVRADPPALILMDELMPGMSGSEAVRALKADARTADIRVVALTAHAQPHVRTRMLDAGCDAVLVKPVLPNALIEAVRRHVKRR